MISAPKTRALALEMAAAAAAYLKGTDPEEAGAIAGAVQSANIKTDAIGDCWFCGGKFEVDGDRRLPYHRRAISPSNSSWIRCDGTGHTPGRPAKAGATAEGQADAA